MSLLTRGEKYALMSVVKGICLLVAIDPCQWNVETRIISRSGLVDVIDCWRASSYVCILSARTMMDSIPTV